MVADGFTLLMNEHDTIAAAEQLATRLQGGDCVALQGELGAGKTLFSRALLRELGVKNEVIPSPTYAIIQPYQGALFPVAHMDWYRMDDAESLLNIGVEEYLQPPWITIIEWPQCASQLLPTHTYCITLKIDDNHPTRRQIQIIHP